MRPARLEGARRGRRIRGRRLLLMSRNRVRRMAESGKAARANESGQAPTLVERGLASGSSSASGTPVAMSTTHRGSWAPNSRPETREPPEFILMDLPGWLRSPRRTRLDRVLIMEGDTPVSSQTFPSSGSDRILRQGMMLMAGGEYDPQNQLLGDFDGHLAPSAPPGHQNADGARSPPWARR